MKVFISWSGSTSQEVAKILKQWIPCVIQSVEPYFSSADIDKGARWSTDIAKELQDASFGILCVTKENLSSAWLNFEAGALSKSIDQSRVCPFLIDLKPADIQNSPILQFQMASSNKEDVKKLFVSINSILGEQGLNETVLDTSFDAFWPKIEADLKKIDIGGKKESATDTADKTQSPIEEILELMRYQHKLLNSPSDLLPPDYLSSIFKNCEKPQLARNSLREIDFCARQISEIANSIVNDQQFNKSNLIDPPDPGVAMPYMEIRDLANRIGRILRRISRESDYSY